MQRNNTYDPNRTVTTLEISQEGRDHRPREMHNQSSQRYMKCNQYYIQRAVRWAGLFLPLEANKISLLKCKFDNVHHKSTLVSYIRKHYHRNLVKLN